MNETKNPEQTEREWNFAFSFSIIYSYISNDQPVSTLPTCMHIAYTIDVGFHGHLRSRLRLWGSFLFSFLSFSFILGSIFPAISAALTSVVVSHHSKMVPSLLGAEFLKNSLFISLSTTLIFSLNFDLTFSLSSYILFYKYSKRIPLGRQWFWSFRRHRRGEASH